MPAAVSRGKLLTAWRSREGVRSQETGNQGLGCVSRLPGVGCSHPRGVRRTYIGLTLCRERWPRHTGSAGAEGSACLSVATTAELKVNLNLDPGGHIQCPERLHFTSSIELKSHCVHKDCMSHTMQSKHSRNCLLFLRRNHGPCPAWKQGSGPFAS